MLLDWLPSVTLNEFAVSARNAATLGKLNAPVPWRKLLLRNCRNSPPILSECRPHRQLMVSAATMVVSPRPDGKARWAAEVESAAGNVDLRQSDGLANTVADSEIGGVELRIRCAACWRGDSEPRRTSLMRFGPKVCVSFSEKNCLCGVGCIRSREWYYPARWVL